MAEYSTPEERTEDPTERRMGELRKEGQLHLSTEVVQVVTLIAGFMVLNLTWQNIISDMQYVLKKSFYMIADSEPLTVHQYYDGFRGLLLLMGPDMLIIMITVAIIAALAVMLQTNWNIKKKIITVKWDFLNPIQGVSKIFSASGFMKTLQSVVKLAVILPIAYFALKKFAPEMVQLMHLSVEAVFEYIGDAMMILFWKIMYVLIALAIIDYFWTRHQWLKKNRMTKDEVKDERKAVEGDEGTKRRMQAKGLQRIAQRIQQSVPQADVVITNPTHFAVALKYDREKAAAPIVVAKGKNFLAQRIKEVARQAGVPVVERKPLARALYSSVEVGKEIPYELFKAVAEVLAYVYRLKNPYGARGHAS